MHELAEPTIAAGETWQDFVADKSAFEDYDVDAAAERGFAFGVLDQLAIEHLTGAR